MEFEWVQIDVATGQSDIVEYCQSILDVMSLMTELQVWEQTDYTNYVRCNGKLVATVVGSIIHFIGGETHELKGN